MNEPLDHAQCGQCGWAGPSTDVLPHPSRPMPLDFGFCPVCIVRGRIVEIDPMTATEFAALMAEQDQ